MASGVGGGPPCAEDPPELLERSLGLYLRPLSRIQIVVKLPQMKTLGQSISNWDLMEKLKKAVVPIQMEAIRVKESSLEIVSFEAELNSRLNMQRVVKGLDGLLLKVAGFADALRVRAAEAKSDCPTRIDWDDHFYKNGQRGAHPDTVHIAMLPLNWFQNGKSELPSEKLMGSAMSVFGEVKGVDIPCCDPLRPLMPPTISGIQKKAYSFGQEVLFEAFIQYKDYSSFLQAMEGLRNQKWMKRTPEGKTFYANVKVDFDRTSHLSETKIRMRDEERERILKEREKKEEEAKKAKAEEEQRVKQEKADKERRKEERELKRKMEYELERRRLERKKLLEHKLAEEEREWAARKATEAKRLLGYVFTRIQARADHEKEEETRRLREELDEVETGRLREALPVDDEAELRSSLLKQREARMRERLKERMRGMVAEVEIPETNGSHKNKDKKKKPKKKVSRSSSSSSRDTFDSHRAKKKKKLRNRSRSDSKKHRRSRPQSPYEEKRKKQ